MSIGLLSAIWQVPPSTSDGKTLCFDDVTDAASALNPAQTAAGRRLPIDGPLPVPIHRRLVHCFWRLMLSGRLPRPSAPANSPAAKRQPAPPQPKLLRAASS